MRILIIGGNAAGPAAAAKAARVNPDAEVIMFEQNPYISTGTCEMTYVISGEIDSYKKVVFFDEESFQKKKGVKVYTKHSVEEIDRRKKRISVRNLNDNSIFTQDYDKLILCTGARTRKLPQISRDVENFFYLKNVVDLKKIMDYMGHNSVKNAVCVGSGYIGLEAAESFNKLGINLTLLEKLPAPMPGTEPEIQDKIVETLKRKDIEFINNVEDPDYLTENNRVTGVKIGSRIIETDLVFASIGFIPENSLAVGAGLEVTDKNTLKVNKKLQTNDPDIYAAGDNIEMVNLVTMRSDYMPLATYARDSGHVAGENAAGGNSYFSPIVKNAAVRLFGDFYTTAGVSTIEADKAGLKYKAVSASVWNKVPIMPDAKKVFGKILYDPDTRRILGGSFLGGEETAGFADMVSLMVRNKMPVDALSENDYNYTPTLSPFINLLSVLGRKSRER